MNKSRITRLERTISQGKRVDLPLFFSVVEGEIIFTDSLLIQLGVNPLDFKEYTGEALELSPKGRRVPKEAKFIDNLSGEDWAPECYLHLKGYEDKRIILL